MIELTLKQAEIDALTVPGTDAYPAALEALKLDYIRKQIAHIDPAELREHLRDFGAWTPEELNDHGENLTRLLWTTAGDLDDEPAAARYVELIAVQVENTNATRRALFNTRYQLRDFGTGKILAPYPPDTKKVCREIADSKNWLILNL